MWHLSLQDLQDRIGKDRKGRDMTRQDGLEQDRKGRDRMGQEGRGPPSVRPTHTKPCGHGYTFPSVQWKCLQNKDKPFGCHQISSVKDSVGQDEVGAHLDSPPWCSEPLWRLQPAWEAARQRNSNPDLTNALTHQKQESVTFTKMNV